MLRPHLPATTQRLLAMASGNWIAAAVHAAAVLRIPDLLSGGPRSAADLAEATQTDCDALRRLLRMLVAHGVFAESEDGRFEQTELSLPLRTHIKGSVRSIVMMYGSDVWRAPWSELVHSIRTGETAFARIHGTELFEYMKGNPEFSTTFDRAMTEGSGRLAAEIVATYDFSECKTIVDVGGGQGLLLSAILHAVPEARGVLVDLPHVIEGARTLVREKGMVDRCELVSGSFFESVPAGADAYVLKWIIHDWNDANATRILRTVRDAVPHTGRLIVCDRVLPERIRAQNPLDQGSTLMDLNMLVNVTGRERTEAEFRRLFAAAGFSLSSARTTPSGIAVVEGRPV